MRKMKLALNLVTRYLHSPLYRSLCAIKLYLVQIYQALLFSALDLDIYAGRDTCSSGTGMGHSGVSGENLHFYTSRLYLSSKFQIMWYFHVANTSILRKGEG